MSDNLSSNQLMQITEVFETTEQMKVNLYLEWGWKIIAVTSGVFKEHEGYVKYSLAWFGKTKPETPDPWKKPQSEGHPEVA
ncbi:hypothetical protein [Acinetobacter baumannii]|uniref:hypothetical protein n=1 Tax=Acinetobacter baumannii TaxID=470 RepID=UPI000744009E|nr:hypothetical protein [Acinetobacter baumannii]